VALIYDIIQLKMIIFMIDISYITQKMETVEEQKQNFKTKVNKFLYTCIVLTAICVTVQLQTPTGVTMVTIHKSTRRIELSEEKFIQIQI
jgi:hypothetical protein